MATAIEKNPDPISEGIWFVIQNKYELEFEDGGDYDTPARRRALTFEGNFIVMKEIPLTGDYDAFLWRVEKKSNQYVLVNRKVINGSANIFNSSLNDKKGKVFPYSAVSPCVVIENYNRAEYGTNVYTIKLESNDQGGGPFEYVSNTDISIVNTTVNNLRQAWVFQPMELMAKYELPKLPNSVEDGNSRFLELPYGYKLIATDTVSEWAILNAHLIYKNMLNALLPDQVDKINKTLLKKEIHIISKEDPHEISSSASKPFDSIWVQKYRGGAASTGITLITEEMMCKTGVLTNTNYAYKLAVYREFEQVVHEFAHALDYVGSLRQQRDAENFAWIVQYLFNSAHSAGPRRNKNVLSQDDKAILSKIFNPENSWIPPRMLRETNNLALHRVTKASSVAYGGDAKLAVDGDTHPDHYDLSVTHTNEEQSPWWEVDLGEIYPIDKVVVWNRIDYQDVHLRLNNFKIAVSEKPIVNTSDATVINFTPQEWTKEMRSQSITIAKRARYIRVFLEGRGVLSLAEFEVFPQYNPKNYFINTPIGELNKSEAVTERKTYSYTPTINTGLEFSSKVAGKITQVGIKMPSKGRYNIYLWDSASASLLKKQEVLQRNDDQNEFAHLDSPLLIEADKKYLISCQNITVDGENRNYNVTMVAFPQTLGPITFHGRIEDVDVNGPDLVYPKTPWTANFIGTPDFTFLPNEQ